MNQSGGVSEDASGTPPQIATPESSSTARTASTFSINHTLDIGSTGRVTATARSTTTITVRLASHQGQGRPFGAVLAEMFLILSVVSKGNDILRLDAVSNLHTYPILGYGMSFIARLVPESDLDVSLAPGLRDTKQVVYKSIRLARQEPEKTPSDARGSRHWAAKLEEFLRELRIMVHEPFRNHENIVRLLGIGWETNRLTGDNGRHTSIFHWPFLVQEFAELGSLADMLDQVLVEPDIRISLCADVGRGLQALHACDVVHGDLKLENVLVFRHPERKYVAKLGDFGSVLLDLDQQSPTTTPIHRTVPWDAPESGQRMAWPDLKLTDVYSFGFLVWRTVAYGNSPFHGVMGEIHLDALDTIQEAKKADLLSIVAESSFSGFMTDQSMISRLTRALECALVLDPRARSLTSCLERLSSTPSNIRMAPPPVPLRATSIPMDQGLGIYAYNQKSNQRLHYQYLHSLESHCIYAQSLENAEITATSDLLLCHSPATLSDHYLLFHVSGHKFDAIHKLTTLDLAMLWTAVSAGAQSTSSVESLIPIMEAFGALDVGINGGLLWVVAAQALYMGSEFMFRELMETDHVPGREKFLEDFRTYMCRGAGSNLLISKEAFRPPFHQFSEFLGKPYYATTADQIAKTPAGVIDATYLLREAAGWGSLDAVIFLAGTMEARVDSQDGHGETALLKSCRAGHVDIVEWLVKEGGASAGIGTTKNVTPLHWINSFPPR